MIQKNAHGFTMMEIMIAIAVVGGIMAVIIPTVMSQREAAKAYNTRSILQKLRASIEGFHSDTDTYPTKLKDLVTRPADEDISANWVSEYAAAKLLKDGWGNDFKYHPTPDGDNPYELYSYGKSGKKAPKSEWINVWKIK